MNINEIHSDSNGSKSNNGNRFEKKFEITFGLNKIKQKDKGRFYNSHGLVQIIDYDYSCTWLDVPHFFDLTTTFRSDRLKQKAYNALMYKTYVSEESKFIMVVESFIEKGKKKKVKLIEGIDGVIDFPTLCDIYNQYIIDFKECGTMSPLGSE
jgi:hypothetical protein